jgi:hypothetical protein
MDEQSSYRDINSIFDDIVMAANPVFAKYKPTRPRYYYPNGKPILSDELMDDTMKWALLFGERDAQRMVARSTTPYGETLSTVWLGLDHGDGSGPPLIFETMMFAPDLGEKKRWKWGKIETEGEKKARKEHEAYIAKHYPHDELQFRYSNRREAEDLHADLHRQSIVPPRWRHFLLWTIGRIEAWKYYDDEDGDLWA